MDVQAAADQIDELISKRSKQREDANRQEEAEWKRPARRRRERIRERNREEWFAYFSGLAESHRKLSEGFEARAALIEDEDEQRSA